MCFVFVSLLTCYSHRRTHEPQANGQPIILASEDDFEQEENEFGSMDELAGLNEKHLGGPLSLG